MKTKLLLHRKCAWSDSYLKQQSAFTLIESLLVLFCITVVLSITTPFFKTKLDDYMYKQAIEKFLMTAIEAQLIAEERGQVTELTLQQKNVVTLTVDGTEVISSWQLPPGMQIHIRVNGNMIRYTSNGTISRLGTVVFQTPNYNKEYSIHFTYGKLIEK